MEYLLPKKDNTERPDHYWCSDCFERFNDAKLQKKIIEDIYVAQAICPECDSGNLLISWWINKKKS